MKKLLLVVLIFCCSTGYSQQTFLNDFNKQQTKITGNSLKILAGWGAANLIYSGASLSSATGSIKYFHQMNLVWGGVNAVLGTAGFLGARSRNNLSFSQSLKKQSGVEKIFLFNAGLDLAYVAGGIYFTEKTASNINRELRNRGYGNSIILQGSALFLFDGLVFLIHQKHGKQLYELAKKMSVSFSGNKIDCMVNL